MGILCVASCVLEIREEIDSLSFNQHNKIEYVFAHIYVLCTHIFVNTDAHHNNTRQLKTQ